MQMVIFSFALMFRLICQMPAKHTSNCWSVSDGACCTNYTGKSWIKLQSNRVLPELLIYMVVNKKVRHFDS